MGHAHRLASRVVSGCALDILAGELDRINDEIDAELAPILEAEEARFMTAQGYVRAREDQPGRSLDKAMIPDTTERMLRAVEDRVSRNEQRLAEGGSGIGKTKMRVRLNESSEILGILRNVVKAAAK